MAIISRTQTNSRADRPEIQKARAGSSTESRPAGRWRALALLCSAQFIVILDGAIVNVALPSIQRDLHFSASSIQWILSAYLLAYGRLLLLGGRTADLLGRGGCSWSAPACSAARRCLPGCQDRRAS